MVVACDARLDSPAKTQVAPPAPVAVVAPQAPPASPVVAPTTPVPQRHQQYLRLAGIDYLEIVHAAPGTAKPDPSQPLPLVLAIHGLGDRPEHFKELLAGLPATVRIIVPRALDPVEDGYSWFPIRARSGDVEGLARGISHAAQRLAEFLQALLQQHPTRGQVVVTGFSQGGMLAFALAVHHPSVIAAAVPVGGWLPPPLWPQAQPKAGTPRPKIVALHGEADPAVMFLPTLDAVTHLEGLGWPATLLRYPEVRHQITPAMREELHRQLVAAIAALP